MALVQTLIDADEFPEAERRAKALVVRSPHDPSLRVFLGQLYLAKKDGGAAYAAFSKASQLGASHEEVRLGLLESQIMLGQYAQVIDLLPLSRDRATLEDPLLWLRVQALLRIPLAQADALFADAKSLLLSGGDGAALALAQLAGERDVVDDNARLVRRALAYWSCQQSTASAPPIHGGGQPSWANLRTVGRRILKVGPGQALKTPSAAARIAQDNDIIEIQAGEYRRDVAAWTARNLWIRATDGSADLQSGGKTAEDMGIWVIRGDNTVVENIRFFGARSTAKNGSGIRLLAHNLWIRKSEFHDNETGVLTFNRPGGEIVIENSVFADNGAGDGYSHNVYVGRTDKLTFRFNYSTGVKIGHQLKSRAHRNYILYNRLADELTGRSSYTIDLPDGGFALVVGNELQQGPRTVNKHLVSLGAEDPTSREHQFIFAFNTFYNNTFPATFIRDHTGAGVTLVNNIFAGAPADLNMSSNQRLGNAFDAATALADPKASDYRLNANAALIDSGEALTSLGSVSFIPEFEYSHPASSTTRQPVWRWDPGAHEFCGWPTYSQ